MAEQIVGTEDFLSEQDEELVRGIRELLWKYEPIRSTRPGLAVKVHNGLVEITGRTRTSAMKEIAEYMILRLPGVRAVKNDIVSDPEVSQLVADALAADEVVGPLCIRVDARAGNVYLAGEAPTDELAGRALEIAAAVPTVVGVVNRMRIGQPTAANGAVEPGRS